jgi:hypothetical protein
VLPDLVDNTRDDIGLSGRVAFRTQVKARLLATAPLLLFSSFRDRRHIAASPTTVDWRDIKRPPF